VGEGKNKTFTAASLGVGCAMPSSAARPRMDQKRREATECLQADTNGKAADLPSNRANQVLGRQDKCFPAHSCIFTVKVDAITKVQNLK